MDIEKIRGIILVICGLFNLFFAFLLWIKGRTKITFHLGWTAFFSAIYAFTFAGLFLFETNKLFWLRATWVGVLIIPAYLTFVYYFTERTRYFKLKSFLWYIGAGIISSVALTTPYIIKFHSPEYPYEVVEGLGPLEPLARIYVIGGLLTGLFYLLREYFKSVGFRKLQTQYFILGIAIYVIGGFLFAGIIPLLYPGAGAYADVAVIFSLPWIGLTTYAVLKRKLFEIKVILTDILVGVMGIILVVLPVVMPTGFLKGLTFGVFLLFCIFAYYLVKATREEAKRREEAEKMTIQERVLREKVERFETISNELKERLSRVLDLENVLSQIRETLIKSFKVDRISFALKQPTSEFYQFYKTIGFSEKEISSLIRDTHLCPYLEETKKPILKTKSEGELRTIQEKIEKNRIDLLFPLFQKERIAGIIFLGKTAQPLSGEELDLLESLSYQISIALQNSLLYEEIKKDKEALEKFYKLTVGRELRIAELKQKITELEEKLREKEGGDRI